MPAKDPIDACDGAIEVFPLHFDVDRVNLQGHQRPDPPQSMEEDLEKVVRFLATNGWPWRMHATYDETASRALDVFERVHRDVPIDKLGWFFDHCETVTPQTLERIKKLGGGIAVQNRMSLQGDYMIRRYSAAAAALS